MKKHIITILILSVAFLVSGCGATKSFSFGTVFEVDGNKYPINIDWEFHPEETKKAGGIPVLVATDEDGNEIKDAEGNALKVYGFGEKSVDFLSIEKDIESGVAVSSVVNPKESSVIRLKKHINEGISK